MDGNGVIVAGAGPVGLVAATLLAGQGIPVTLVEAERTLPDDLRASTFHPATMDLLQPLGVTERLVEEGLVCPHWQFRDRREGVVATFDLGRLSADTGHPYRLQCEQWRLTRMLRDRLAGNPDVRILYGTRAVAARQDADHAYLAVEHEGGEAETLRARYVIGADGARSAVRKSLDVEFEGMTIPEIFLSLSTPFRFDEAVPDLANIAYISDPEEWLVLLRTRSVWRVLIPVDPGKSDAEITDPAFMEAKLQAVQPAPHPYAVAHRTAYRVHERVASRYVVGRILLAGDAAHLNNPLGGMGMNGGIQDAVNLAGKLGEVWRGAAPELLGRYERQRRKVALEVVQQQSLRNRAILNQRDPAQRRAYHDELRAIADDPVRHREYVLRSSMIQSLRDLEAVA
ncbi:FAD-dependent monooxygenase [Roseomonas sp. NAR14]|uniref:FAD-dependent monooxygenase n=1 Tax=Roseomonas acroporae TaxID=2937791 RepID=A0A9X1Y796_9PROT|nr:FAD-dependent monooxygenase [Roseomonas acroporae]MCK8784448.1 FAD-dependent monooxygenase [Roseomonas acroporae]